MMRSPGAARVLILALVGDLLAQAPASSWDTPRTSEAVETIQGVEYVPGEVIVGLRNWDDVLDMERHARTLGDSVLGAIPRLRSVRVGIAASASRTIDNALAGYLVLPMVAYAERNAVQRPLASCVDDVPDDTYFDDQWHLDNTGQSGGTADADIDAEGYLAELDRMTQQAESLDLEVATDLALHH